MKQPDLQPTRIDADIETASDDYAVRFAGKTGAWMLKIQEHQVLSSLADIPRGSAILEVGGGHGQLAQALINAGYRVTVTGSDQSCRRRIDALVSAGKCEFLQTNPLALPFADREFAAVVCVRLLMHCGERWPALIKEFCRVARQSVVVDYPTNQSLNCLANLLFPAKLKLEGNTRTFRLFRHREIADVFRACGFRQRRRTGQFFWPMVLHRILRQPLLSSALEWLPKITGLTRRWGSPIILCMQRHDTQTTAPMFTKATPASSIPAGTPVLVTGATGFTGAVLTRKLADAGLQVRAIARHSSNLEQLRDVPVQWFRGDVFDPAVVAEATRGVVYIFHVAAAFREARHDDDMYTKVHVVSTQLLAQAAMQNPNFRRFVHVSTVGVLGHIEHPPADETTPMNPGDIYQQTKAEAEKWLIDFAHTNNLPFTVIRPAAIYGPGDTRLLKLFRMAARPCMILLGHSRGLYHLTHVDDLTNVIILAAEHPAAAGEVFICGSPEAITLENISRIVASALGRRLRVIRLPAWPVFLAADICEALCRRLKIEPPLHRRRVAFFTKDRSFNTTKLRERLGYRPLHSDADGLKETTQWYCQQGWLT
ncbi:MAG: NAD-dependent epimerase/dehydratase family protein [Kiritimatiellia bacterium]|jgi:dihydroflavonol-4-reductase